MGYFKFLYRKGEMGKNGKLRIGNIEEKQVVLKFIVERVYSSWKQEVGYQE